MEASRLFLFFVLLSRQHRWCGDIRCVEWKVYFLYVLTASQPVPLTERISFRRVQVLTEAFLQETRRPCPI